MSFLDQGGDLAREPLAAILLEALNLRATGALVVERAGGTFRLYLRDGAPVGAQLFLGFTPLGQFLLARKLIGMDALWRSLQEMARTGRHQGEILVEMGAITRAQLDQALADQQTAYVALFAAMDDGPWRFDAATAVPEWTRGVHLAPLRTIVDALEKPQARHLVDAALHEPGGGPVVLAAGHARLAGAFGWSDAERAALGRLERPTTVQAFLAAEAAPPARARAVLASLLLLGLAGPPGAGPDADPDADPVADLVRLLAPAPAAAPAASAPAAAPAAAPSPIRAPAAAPPHRPAQAATADHAAHADPRKAAAHEALAAAASAFKKAEACLRARDWGSARELLQRAIRQHPKPEYEAALAYCHLLDTARRDLAAARELLARAVRDPTCDRAQYVAGLLALEEGDEHAAEKLFRAALRANPGHLEAGRELRRMGTRRKA